MIGTYGFLKQVIALVEEYELENKQLDLLDFANWTISKLNGEPNLNPLVKTGKQTKKEGSNLTISKTKNNKARFLESVSRIARYHDFYIRKALQELNINSRPEFLFLQTVNTLDKAKKTDLIQLHLLEYTTGMDTIRRLIKNDMIYETQDPNDKRAKLLALTERGFAVLKQAERRIEEENDMFFAAINENKWKKTLPLIEEIDTFHNSVYLKHNDKPFAEICNLIDSLKHIYA